jgi:hypothetical protein
LLRVRVLVRNGTSRVKRSKRSRRVKVSADGVGVVSHAGVGMLRELARDTGLTAGVTAALADTYAGPWVHSPGRVFTDMAVAIADGADCVSHIEVVRRPTWGVWSGGQYADDVAVAGPDR